MNDAIFAEVTYHAAYEPQRCVRTPRWKYIRRFDERGKIALPNCDDSPTKMWLLERGYADRAVAEEQLYDLWFDPQEMNNLAARRKREAANALPICVGALTTGWKPPMTRYCAARFRRLRVRKSTIPMENRRTKYR